MEINRAQIRNLFCNCKKSFFQRFNDFCMQITDTQNKRLFVFDTVFIRTIIWFTRSPDHGPDNDSIENKMSFILYNYDKQITNVVFNSDINFFLLCVMILKLFFNWRNVSVIRFLIFKYRFLCTSELSRIVHTKPVRQLY